MADYNINAVTRRVVYTGSAGVGPYAFSFEVLAATDIAVYKNATKLTLTTNYTVTINANGTGSITLTSAATGSDKITIIGARAIERTTDFVTAGDLLAASLNEQLDSQIVMIQQLAEENKRTMKAPQYDPASSEDGGTLNMTLPTAASRAGNILAFDNSGNPIATEAIGEWRGNWATATSYGKRDLVKDTSNSNVYVCVTAHTSTGTQPISSNAGAANWALLVDAASVSASESAAAASASTASTQAGIATTQAGIATSQATISTTQATNSAASATAAAAARTAAESARDATLAAYDSFDDRYLGAKASDPSVDNDGNALVAGALYFNSTDGIMKLYTGSSWVAAYVSGSGFLALSGGTLTGTVNFLAGSVSAPGITTTGDTNTGIFFPSADTIAFAEGGVEAMRINASGQVVTTAGTAALPAVTTTGDTNTGMFFPAADTIAFGSNGTEELRIGPAGQLGIQGANYGTSGQVLTSQGSGSAPVWASVSGGVTSLTAGNGITVSASTGAVTVSQDIYTGSTANNTSYPIGTCLLTQTGNSGFIVAESRVLVLQNNNASNQGFVPSGTGTSLTGTWRGRGSILDGATSIFGYLYQRTA